MTSKNRYRGRPARKLLLGSRSSGGRRSGASGGSSTSRRSGGTFGARNGGGTGDGGRFGRGFFFGHLGADDDDALALATLELDALLVLVGDTDTTTPGLLLTAGDAVTLPSHTPYPT